MKLLDFYPTVKHAVAWVELFLCSDIDGTPALWPKLLEAYPEPEALLGEVRGMIAESAKDEPTPATRMRLFMAAYESRRPEFTTYIAGKMGVV